MFRWIILGGVFALISLFTQSSMAAQPQDAACANKIAVTSGSTGATIESGGLTRIYRIYVPSGYDESQPTALVFSLHGVVSSAAEQEEKTTWNDVAERENFIAVYPQGAISAFTGWGWNAGTPLLNETRSARDAEGREIDDVRFIADLIAHLKAEFCVDTARVYVTGFSNGGGMSNHLACTLSTQIAAIGTVAGAYTPIPGGCAPERPMPVITFQGKLDGIVPYEGSEQLGMQGVESWAAEWAARNSCDETPSPIEREKTDAVTGFIYTGCKDDASVVFYAIADSGHTWPGGLWKLAFILGKTSTDISASETMWTFFSQHPMTGDF